MVLDRYRRAADVFLEPLARGLGRAGVRPDSLTTLSLVLAILSGVTLFLASPSREGLLVLSSLLVASSALFDALDGKLARLLGKESPRGDFLDHSFDRFSDVAILLGLSFSPLGSLPWGILAVAGTLLTSYMGTQSQALGLGRDYGGILSRADRLVLLTLSPLLAFLEVRGQIPLEIPLGILPLTLLYLAVVGFLTSLQRFLKALQALQES